MKVFDTFEKVEDMVRCRKIAPAFAKQINEPFRVNTLEGNYIQGKVGDYLMCGVKGELYICDKDILYMG